MRESPSLELLVVGIKQLKTGRKAVGGMIVQVLKEESSFQEGRHTNSKCMALSGSTPLSVISVTQ